MSQPGIVVVGGSYAGLNAAATARTAGYAGCVTLLGSEARLPYQRPPLSKDFLRGGTQVEQLPLRPAAFFETSAIALRTGTTVLSIDRGTKTLLLQGGDALSYDKLVLATGCRPLRMDVPGADAAGIHVLRTLDDAQVIASKLEAAR